MAIQRLAGPAGLASTTDRRRPPPKNALQRPRAGQGARPAPGPATRARNAAASNVCRARDTAQSRHHAPPARANRREPRHSRHASLVGVTAEGHTYDACEQHPHTRDAIDTRTPKRRAKVATANSKVRAHDGELESCVSRDPKNPRPRPRVESSRPEGARTGQRVESRATSELKSRATARPRAPARDSESCDRETPRSRTGQRVEKLRDRETERSNAGLRPAEVSARGCVRRGSS